MLNLHEPEIRSFEDPKHMFKLIDKKRNSILCFKKYLTGPMTLSAVLSKKLSHLYFDIYEDYKGVCALRGYFGLPMRSKNKGCSSQVSSY